MAQCTVFSVQGNLPVLYCIFQCSTDNAQFRVCNRWQGQFQFFSDSGERSEPQSEKLADIDWNCLLSKLLNFVSAKIKFPDESFQNNNQTYTGERYKNLDIYICNHKS